MTVDDGRLRFLLDRISEETDQLRRLAAMTDEELFADPDRLPGVKYRFVIAIEAAIDACQHAIAAEGLRAPKDFADAFLVLHEAGLLVHGYGRVDDTRVVEILRTRLDDLDAFRRALATAVS